MEKTLDTKVLNAVNSALEKLKQNPLKDLNDTTKADKDLSCNQFAPLVLDNILKAMKCDEPKSENYRLEKKIFKLSSNKFINFSLMFNVSSLNHNFNVYTTNDSCYVIQTYLEHEVQICKKMSMTNFDKLYGGVLNCDQKSYNELFQVDLKSGVYLKIEDEYITSISL